MSPGLRVPRTVKTVVVGLFLLGSFSFFIWSWAGYRAVEPDTSVLLPTRSEQDKQSNTAETKTGALFNIVTSYDVARDQLVFENEDEIRERDKQITTLQGRIDELEEQLQDAIRQAEQITEEEIQKQLVETWQEIGDLSVLGELGYVAVPLLRKNGYFEIQTEINGEKAYFLLDTGASVSIMDDGRKEDFNLIVKPLNKSQEYAGLGGSLIVEEEATISEFKVGEIKLSDVQFPLVDLAVINSSLEEGGQYPVHGLLGDDFFEANSAVIDFAGQKVYFRRPNPEVSRSTVEKTERQ